MRVISQRKWRIYVYVFTERVQSFKLETSCFLFLYLSRTIRSPMCRLHFRVPEQAPATAAATVPHTDGSIELSLQKSDYFHSSIMKFKSPCSLVSYCEYGLISILKSRSQISQPMYSGINLCLDSRKYVIPLCVKLGNGM